MSLEIRPFRRDDRVQLTGLVNAHVGAVVPGISVSVNAVMSQLEREPGEFIVDPWVLDRHTLVAVERDAVVAGAHLLRYRSDGDVGECYRDAGEIRWLVCSPSSMDAGHALAAGCVEVLNRWDVACQWADGALPAPCVYGVPSCWGHVRQILVTAGFAFTGHVDIILTVAVDQLPTVATSRRQDLSVLRSVGVCGTRFTARLGDEAVGMIEVETDMTDGGTRSRVGGWGDIGNLCVSEEHRRRGIGTRLLATAGDWLRLGRVERLIDYAWPEQTDLLAFLHQAGFGELVCTERGWQRAAQ